MHSTKCIRRKFRIKCACKSFPVCLRSALLYDGGVSNDVLHIVNTTKPTSLCYVDIDMLVDLKGIQYMCFENQIMTAIQCETGTYSRHLWDKLRFEKCKM